MERNTPTELRNNMRFGSVSATRLYVKSGNSVLKADAEGLYVGDSEGNQLFSVDMLNGWTNFGPDTPLYERDPQVASYWVRDTNNYYSLNLINTSNGEYASADIGAVNNNPDPLHGYVDFGINGIGWNDPDYAVFDAEAGYMWCVDNNFYIGTGGAGKSTYFFNGGFDSKSFVNVEINGDGVLIPKKTTEANEPSWVEGGIYYNTTKHKLFFGGQSGWEQVTGTTVESASSSASPSPSASESASV